MTYMYRVIAKGRVSGKVVECYTGESEKDAIATFEDLLNRKMFMDDFRVQVQRLEPVVFMESK